MYMVYWTEVGDATNSAHGRAFESEDMLAAMTFMEQLRVRQRSGEAVCFITMSSENPNSVGPSGVSGPPADYNWKKRRR